MDHLIDKDAPRLIAILARPCWPQPATSGGPKAMPYDDALRRMLLALDRLEWDEARGCLADQVRFDST